MTLPTLSDDWLEPYRASPFSLRFELGGEEFGNDAPVPRFVQAFDRARHVAKEIFGASSKLFGIVATSPDPRLDFFAPATDGFVALAEAGFMGEHVREWSAPLWPSAEAEEDRVPTLWRAYDLSERKADRDTLLWAAISHEMAISPKAPVSPFIVDFEQSVLLDVYDDRGMDLISLDRKSLLAIYRNRGEWLLAYDRERIAKAFSD